MPSEPSPLDANPPLFSDYAQIAIGVPRNPNIPGNADASFHDMGACGPERTDKHAIMTPHGQSGPAVALFAAMIGLLLWFVGMATLLRGMPRAPMVFASVVPLLTLPWWGEQMPLATGRLDARVGMSIALIHPDAALTALVHNVADEEIANGGRSIARRGLAERVSPARPHT